MTSRSTTLALFLVAPVSFAADITVGPAGSGADFPEIQDAVLAAAPGDRILVAAGTYSPFEVSRGMRIVGEGRGAVVVQNVPSNDPWLAARVTNLPAGEEVVISGMTLNPQALPNSGPFFQCDPVATGLLLDDNDGRVVVHDVELLPGPQVSLFQERAFEAIVGVEASAFVLLDELEARSVSDNCPTAPILSTTSSTVWISGSTFRQPDIIEPDAVAGGTAIEALDSVLYVARSLIEGGNGDTTIGFCFGGPTSVGTPGGPAITLRGDSLLKAVGGGSGALTGGAGGTSPFGAAGCGAAGAPAVELYDTSVALLAEALPVEGGANGFSFGSAPPFAPATTLAGNATQIDVDALYPTMRALGRSAPIGTASGFELNGEPFRLAVLFAAFGTGDPTPLPGVIDGAWALDITSQFLLRLALIDAAGVASIPIQIPADPTLEGVVIFLQWVQTDGTVSSLSNPTTLSIGG